MRTLRYNTRSGTSGKYTSGTFKLLQSPLLAHVTWEAEYTGVLRSICPRTHLGHDVLSLPYIYTSKPPSNNKSS